MFADAIDSALWHRFMAVPYGSSLWQFFMVHGNIVSGSTAQGAPQVLHLSAGFPYKALC
jgi:hypothetical protein